MEAPHSKFEPNTEKTRTKFFYHWAKKALTSEQNWFLTKTLPKAGKDKLLRNAIRIWRGYIHSRPNRTELTQQLNQILDLWQKADQKAVHNSFCKEQNQRIEVRAQRREKEERRWAGVTVTPILNPEQMGIHPYPRENVTREDELANQVLLSSAIMNRKNFPPNDRYIAMLFKLSKLAAENRCHITIMQEGFQGDFARDNYGHIPRFLMETYENASHTAVVIRRFEEGPHEVKSGLPYKTLGGMRYTGTNWSPISEEEMISAHTTDATTGEKLPTETAVLFSTIPEMFPSLID